MEELLDATVPRIIWPGGKAFAFTVFDDTDLATLQNVPHVYEFLHHIGLRTTKSVWPIRGQGTPRVGGMTCADPEYRAWTFLLQHRGFEIGYHGATYLTSPRAQVIRALDEFRNIYGQYPDSMANHSGCAESIYWGADRLTGINRLAYDVMTRFQRRDVFRGHREGDALFWGDICRARIRYVRNFTYADVDTLRACPQMPYHDAARPYVNAWFASSEGADVRAFNARLDERNQDRLAHEGGACVMYTHFGSGFYEDGTLNKRFAQLMDRLARMNGWFAPVTELLDYVRAQRGLTLLTAGDRSHLERKWLASKARIGYS
jgi:hypothetical protein